jgi:hypothetical protein
MPDKAIKLRDEDFASNAWFTSIVDEFRKRIGLLAPWLPSQPTAGQTETPVYGLAFLLSLRGLLDARHVELSP